MNKNKFSKKELQFFKDKLLAQKAEILELVEKNVRPTTSEVGDEIDLASQTLEKEMFYQLTNHEQQILLDLENALQKIEKRIYGFCESCQKKIPTKRLKAMPYTRYCISCQAGREKTQGSQ